MKKINISNMEKIEAKLYAVQKRCEVRTLSYDNILRIIEIAEKRLTEIGIPKKLWTGIEIGGDDGYACNLPASYTWTAMSTSVRLYRGSTAWFLLYAERGPACTGSRNIFFFNLSTPERNAAILRKAHLGIGHSIS